MTFLPPDLGNLETARRIFQRIRRIWRRRGKSFSRNGKSGDGTGNPDRETGNLLQNWEIFGGIWEQAVGPWGIRARDCRGQTWNRRIAAALPDAAVCIRPNHGPNLPALPAIRQPRTPGRRLSRYYQDGSVARFRYDVKSGNGDTDGHGRTRTPEDARPGGGFMLTRAGRHVQGGPRALGMRLGSGPPVLY